jgi:hypothetical protein
MTLDWLLLFELASPNIQNFLAQDLRHPSHRKSGQAREVYEISWRA